MLSLFKRFAMIPRWRVTARLAWLGAIVLTATGCPQRPAPNATSNVWPKIDAEFANPPAKFRLVQYSKHDGALLPYAKMAASGIGGVKLFMRSDGYLRSEEAWDNIGKNIAAADEAGFDVWIADDNGYPSGMAGGLVVEADPAFETRCLIEASKTGEGATSAVTLDLPKGAEKFVYAFLYPVVDGKPDFDRAQAIAVEADRVKTSGLEGPWQLSAFAVQISREGTQAESTKEGFKTSGRYPNLLNAAAMEKFVALTHEEYARRFGPLAGKVDVFYANEPNLMTLSFKFDGTAREDGRVFVPWDPQLPARFEKDHGYDLLPRLPALYGGDDEASKLVRRHFYQTVGAMLAENFSGRIGTWAEKNGVAAGGHPLLEESMLHHVIGYGDFFKFLEPMQVPAVDLPMPDGQSFVLRALHFGAPWNYWMPKFLSSVAQAKNRETVAGLLDPMIARSAPNLTLPTPNIRRIVNMAAFCGVNKITNYLLWDQYDPADYRALNEYIGRISLVLRGARSAATVAVYYPIETFQAEFLPSPSMWSPQFWPKAWHRMVERIADQDEVARSLILRGIDFNWLHGDWIREGSVQDGALVAAGGRYTTIVMPEVEVLPLDVAERIAEFEKAGGKVVWVKSLPVLGDGATEHEKVRALFAGRETVKPANVTKAIGPVLPPGFDLRTDGTPLIARFVRGGHRINFLVNYRDKPMTVPLESARGEALAVRVYDPLGGTIKEHQAPATATIGPFSSLFVVEDPAAIFKGETALP